ncbi:TIGR04282 family arsenosugar biosynthesis glycosyltransferase [Nitrosovibrio tenuis]|uniref:DUF2064 domain-containing protein n=1 Tax=Nitrosovibrio tenuis TaxID=1233 RepID=A0A1H7LCJ3_9PROT|nr:DUF2064 domain-containing protein [Nitrosovibrio tenuis]SEK96067.1 hypothetical protein SAMN05216387_1045 [Nitrosovibrio tenuis]
MREPHERLMQSVAAESITTDMIEAALVLVCKRPGLGIGKQRLAASLGRMAASRVAEALLACALEDTHVWSGPVVIAPAHAGDYAWAEALLPGVHPKTRVEPQSAGNLGQRLNILDRKLRAAGLEELVYIGSDAPALEAADYAAASEAMEYHDTVLMPSLDGGVVLMASRKHWPPLGGLPWSTPHLGIALADCCHDAGQSVSTLTHGFDVDEADDLVRLITSLSHDRRPARRALHELASHIVQLGETDHVQF